MYLLDSSRSHFISQKSLLSLLYTSSRQAEAAMLVVSKYAVHLV